jgi:Rho GTPase-activating protein 12/27
MVLVKKDSKETSKKNVISVQSRSGALLLVQSPTEAEFTEWFSSISEATKENSSDSEYQNVVSKLFVSNQLPPPGVPKLPKKKSHMSDPKRSPSLIKAVVDEDSEEPNKQTVKARLNNFFKRAGDIKIDKAKETPLPPDQIVFGGNLESLAKISGMNVPDFLRKCIQHVQQHGLDSQGIYRLSGNAATVQKFRTQLNHNNDSDLFIEDTDVNVVAALLKLFLREIQIPVIPFQMYTQFIDVMKIEDYNSRLCDIKTMVQQLPKVHYDVLEALMRHLVIVASHSEINKMEPSNLAIVFGPSLIRQPETNVADMQAAYANMMNMSFQNALIESMVIQTEVISINVVVIRWKSKLNDQ